ncbi:MAG: HlyD family efflux transporter periplasmic adaptor subunit [Xanthomonadales bacterium]|nr:HlyD family efflux transporter periplasmic adaptor subunit [Xanthomonadales bacterium]NIX12189.1 HlyD family efflux transporter periplasmic adaptor subunit [Xanthomonadales bacterium]
MRKIAILVIVLLAACETRETGNSDSWSQGRELVTVTGELRSAKSLYFGPPNISDIWNHTISFMAPDGAMVREGRPILRFDPQQLETKLRDKNNALNEKQKALEKSEIVAREQLAELKLQIEEAKAALDKAILKADIPETLLASRDYQENQLLLRQAELNFELRKIELEKEEKIQATEIEILQREVGILQLESDQLRESIKAMTIRAPNEGVVIHAVDRHGNKQSVGDSVWRGRRVLEFPDLRLLEAHLEIPERESARIKVGQKVRFSMDAAPDQQFFGEIVELASVIHTRSRNQPEKIFDATVALADLDTKLMRPGMSINAEIMLDAGSGP